MIEFACPECGHPFKVADEAAGRRGTCKSCQAMVTVPAVRTPAAQPIDVEWPHIPDGPTIPIQRSGEAAESAKTELIEVEAPPSAGIPQNIQPPAAANQGQFDRIVAELVAIRTEVKRHERLPISLQIGEAILFLASLITGALGFMLYAAVSEGIGGIGDIIICGALWIVSAITFSAVVIFQMIVEVLHGQTEPSRFSKATTIGLLVIAIILLVVYFTQMN